MDHLGKANSTRGSEPRAWKPYKATGGIPVDKLPSGFSFHHQIPYNILWGSWNEILDACFPENGNPADGAEDCAKTYMRMLGMDADDIYGKIAGGRNGTGDGLGGEERDELDTKLTWIGWNIVVGPESSIRADDPGERWDDFGQAFSENNLLRLELLANRILLLNSALGSIMANGATAGRIEEAATQFWWVEKMFGYFDEPLRFPVCPYDPDMWRRVDPPRKPGKPWLLCSTQ
jgi:hypothetical protein